jgi:SAM-dependent methyltransferase
MSSFDRDRQAASFEQVADAYERARPGYPDDAVRWLAGTTPSDVLDLAAGTGKLTRALVALGHRVTAVEPLPAMLAQLRVAAPGAIALEGTAEQIPLQAEAVDVVAVAQAFHWFDADQAVREIARVLRPGGVLALVWNQRVEGERWIEELNGSWQGSDHPGIEEDDGAIAVSGLYGPVERATFGFTQQLDRDGLRDLVLSRSYCAVLPEDERRPVLAQLDVLFDDHAVDGKVALPYVTECFRAARL